MIPQTIINKFQLDCLGLNFSVLHDQGEYRHFQLNHPESSLNIEIITWPHHVQITGSYGYYLFSISNYIDMLKLLSSSLTLAGFRSALVPEQIYSPTVKFWNPTAFKKAVYEFLDNNLDTIEYLLNDEEEQNRVNAIRSNVALNVENISSEEAANHWISTYDYQNFHFEFFHEYDCTSFTNNFMLACLAITHISKLYSATSQERAQ
ncbi:hypothetical protein [Marinomonas sp.]